jgi:hypothetical protein
LIKNPVAFIGQRVLGGTSGSIPYIDSNSALAQDNTKLFWDATNKRLGVSIAAPVCPLDVDGTSGNYTDGLSLNRYGVARFSRTNTTSLSGGDSDGQMHLELSLNPSTSYAGLATNTLTSFLLIPSGNAQNFTTTGMRAANFTFRHLGTGTVSTVNGLASGFGLTSTGTVTTLIGIAASAINSGGGTITLLESFRVSQPSGRTSGSPNSTFTTIYGINIQDQTPTGASNTVTNAPIALKIQNQTGSGAYGIQMGTGLNYFAGSVRIGSTTAPTNALDVTGTATASVQVTTPVVSGGTGSGNTLILESNDTTWPRTAYITTDHLTIGANYTYPTGSAATLYAIQINEAISSIDVANPNINTMNIVPTWTYTTGQSWGLVLKAALNFIPNVTSAVGAGGTDSCIYAGINTQPQLTISSGSRTWTNFWGLAVDPRNVGTSGTITAMIGVRTRGSVASGTTATSYQAFTSDFSSVSGSTVGTFYGSTVQPTLAGTTTDFFGHLVAPSITGTCTNFYGFKVTDSSTPSGTKIAFYHSGTNAHSRFQGMVMIGADSAPSYPLHVTGSIASSSLTSGRVPFATTNGELIDDSTMTFGSTRLTLQNLTSTNDTFLNLVSIGGSVYSYNSVDTVGNGMSCIRAQVNLTAQSAAVGTTTLYTPGISNMYCVNIYLKVTRAATTSSTLGAVTIGFTDPTDSVAQSVTVQLGRTDGNSGSTYIGNNTTTVLQGKCIIHAKNGVAITYAIGYTSSGATTMQYKATIRLEEI